MLPSHGHVFLSPCYAVGFCSDAATVGLVLFDAYVECEEAPVAEFRASLSARRSGGAGGKGGGGSVRGTTPSVYQARVELSLKMGECLRRPARCFP